MGCASTTFGVYLIVFTNGAAHLPFLECILSSLLMGCASTLFGVYLIVFTNGAAHLPFFGVYLIVFTNGVAHLPFLECILSSSFEETYSAVLLAHSYDGV